MRSGHLAGKVHRTLLVQAVRCALSPPVQNLRVSSATTAVAVARAAAADGVATSKPDNLVQAVQDSMWQPVYHGGAV
jgi:malate dehydrogenase (oxaloacetate-decarboxylating)